MKSVLFFTHNGGSHEIQKTPPVPDFRIMSYDRPRARKSNMQHGIGFGTERLENFPRWRDGGHVRRKDGYEIGLRFHDRRINAGIIGGIRFMEGRPCGRAAARPEARRGRMEVRTRSVRLTGSAFFRQNPAQVPTRKDQADRRGLRRGVASPRHRLRAEKYTCVLCDNRVRISYK